LNEYREKFVAVWNQRVIDADKNLKRLSKKVKEKTRSAKGVYVGYVSEKPVEIFLDIAYGKLSKSEQDISGIGGSVETYEINDSVLIFGEHSIKTPVFVLKHPLGGMNEAEKITDTQISFDIR